MSKAPKKKPSLEAVREFLSSPEGREFLITQMPQENAGQEQDETVRPLFTDAHREEVNRISLGLPDAAGRVPGQREQMAALGLLASFSVPKPTASDQAPVEMVVVSDPFAICCECQKRLGEVKTDKQ